MTRPRPQVDLRGNYDLDEEKTEFGEIAALPDAQRRELCEKLLEEFGVDRFTEQSGGELLHSCPLPGNVHSRGDRNPSARLNYRKLVFTCWSCGRSGGLLWFIATCRHSDEGEARRWLTRETGTGGQEMGWAAVLTAIEAAWQRRGTAAGPMPRYGARVLDEWLWPRPYPMLTADPSEPAPEGMRGRGIPAATLQAFKVGYAPEYEMRTEKGMVIQERIIIPHFWQSELVGWQARKVDPRDKPKYKSTPGFPKDQTLFNHTKRRRYVLVESPMSVLRHHHHVPEMEATFGTSVTTRQLQLVRSADEVVIWFDNDPAGWEGTRRIIDAISDHTDVLVVPSPFDADPADLDDDTVARLLRKSRPWPLWSPPDELTPLEAA